MFLYLSQTMAVVFYVKMQNPYTSKIKLKELQEMFYIVCVECFVRQAGYDTCMQHLIKTFGFVGMAASFVIHLNTNSRKLPPAPNTCGLVKVIYLMGQLPRLN